MIYAHAHGRLNDIHTVVVVVSIFKRFTSRFFEMSFLLLLFLLVFFFIYFVLHSFASEFRGSSFRVFTQLVLFFLYFRYHIAVFSIVFLSAYRSSLAIHCAAFFYFLCLPLQRCLSVCTDATAITFAPRVSGTLLSVLDGKSQKWLLSEKEIFPIIFLEDFHSRECDSS